MTKAEKERKKELFQIFWNYLTKARKDLEKKGVYEEWYWPVFAMAQQHVEAIDLSTMECEYKTWKEYIEHKPTEETNND